MNAKEELNRVKEWAWMRGFANLYQKESRAWWSTRRWWINGLLWTVLIVGLVAVWMFVFPPLYAAAGVTTIADLGGPVAFGLKMLFNVGGGMAVAVGVIVLCQDLIIGEKQNGLTEWLLAKPVQRRAYVLAKLCASLVAVALLLVALPGAVAYGVLWLGAGGPLPLLPFLAGMGIFFLHSLFYLTLALMLGTFFSSRAIILGVAIGILFVGMFFSGILKPLLAISPWMLPTLAEFTAGNQAIPPGQLWPPLIASALWCVVFTLAAIVKFERTEQ
jgi:ABC-type transport system involved in multi-copper enzyme maturation permease subunit